jgi:hypothetical protein
MDGESMPDNSKMPIRPTKAPSAVAKQPNGAVDEALMGIVDRPEKMFKMAALPSRGMRAMHAAIKRDMGVTLTTTGRGRTLAQQWQIFGGDLARYRPCSVDEFNINHALDKELTKVFPAKDRAAVALLLVGVTIPESDHWTKIPFTNGTFPATAAVPGTSPHGLWCADDLALPDGDDRGKAPDGLGDAVVNWLFAHEMDFGFAHGTRSERWHVQWFVGDTIPKSVLDFELTNPPVDIPSDNHGLLTPITPLTSLAPKEELDMIKAIKTADSEAIFSASGIVASWISDPNDYERAVHAGLVPPMEQVEIVDRSTFQALRLVGPIPPGFTAADFEEVIDNAP